MAVFVTSDAHGHLRALDRALELASPGAGDLVVIMGDMVDRGPDPVGVLRLARDLPGATVLMGNHEQMMLSALASGDAREVFSWELNGGASTARGLDGIDTAECSDLLDWLGSLPTFAVVETVDTRRAPAAEPRAFLLAHAGIDAASARAHLAGQGVVPGAAGGYADASSEALHAMMAAQDPEDLLWIRAGFWSTPTGLVGADGSGPVVVAGHTPSALLGRYATLMSGRGLDEHDRGCVVEVGASQDTGGVADRVCIDCSAAMGAPFGRVGIMRLEDRRTWYADIAEGE